MLGQTLTDTDGMVDLSDDGSHVLVHDLRSSVKGGALTADASVGLQDHDDYRIGACLVGVPLGDFLGAARRGGGRRLDRLPALRGRRSADRQGLCAADMTGRRDHPEAREGTGVVRGARRRLGRARCQAFSLLQLTLPGSPGLRSRGVLHHR